MTMQSVFALCVVSLATLSGSFARGAESAGDGAALKAKPEMQKEADRASKLVRAGNYREAEKIYKDLSERFPASAFAFYELGRCLLWQQKYKLAVEAFTRASALAPNEAAPLECLGRTYHAQGKLNEAVDSYQRALAITPSDKQLKKGLDRVTLDRDSQKRPPWLDQAQKKPTTASINEQGNTAPWEYGLAPNSEPSLGLENTLPEQFLILNGVTFEADSPNFHTGVRLPSAARGEPLFVNDRRVWPVGDYLTPLEQSRLVIPPSNRVR